MVNLHIHSKLSLEGCLDINEIIKIANENELELISITDHNTVNAYYEIKEKFNGKIIKGLEADAVVNGTTFDFLCYDFDSLENIREWCNKKYLTIENRQEKIYQILIQKCKEHNINYDDTKSYNSSTEYAHDAILRMLKLIPKSKELLKKFEIETSNDFYRQSTMNKEFPLYINMETIWPSINELIEIIHQNNGKVFIAHPFKYKSVSALQVLEEVKNLIDGIEIYNNNSAEEIKVLYDYAKKNNLLISAGTDFYDMSNNIKLDLDNNKQLEIKEEFLN